ncbi:MAG: hypothetical protein ABL958_15810 [Bdellovibrionia bacterium]
MHSRLWSAIQFLLFFAAVTANTNALARMGAQADKQRNCSEYLSGTFVRQIDPAVACTIPRALGNVILSSTQNQRNLFSEDPLRDCIRAGLSHSSAAVSGGQKVYKCESRTSQPVNMGRPPCWDDPGLVDYTYSLIVPGIRCLSPPNDPLDYKEMMSLIAHESHFVADVSSVAGRGLMQMTGIAIREARGDIKADGTHARGGCLRACKKWKSVIDQPACADFQEALKPTAETRNRTPTCEVVGSHASRQRNVIYGLSLYLHYRDLARNMVRRGRRLRNGDASALRERFTSPTSDTSAMSAAENDMVKLMTRIMYNQGPGPAESLFRQVNAELAQPGQQMTPANVRQTIIRIGNTAVDKYLQGIDSSTAAMHGEGKCQF